MNSNLQDLGLDAHCYLGLALDRPEDESAEADAREAISELLSGCVEGLATLMMRHLPQPTPPVDVADEIKEILRAALPPGRVEMKVFRRHDHTGPYYYCDWSGMEGGNMLSQFSDCGRVYPDRLTVFERTTLAELGPTAQTRLLAAAARDPGPWPDVDRR